MKHVLSYFFIIIFSLCTVPATASDDSDKPQKRIF